MTQTTCRRLPVDELWAVKQRTPLHFISSESVLVKVHRIADILKEVKTGINKPYKWFWNSSLVSRVKSCLSKATKGCE